MCPEPSTKQLTQTLYPDRDGPFPIIRYSTKGPRRRIQKCSSVILAFPPTLSALQAAHLDLSPAERHVFGPVGVNDYYSGATRVQTLFSLVLRVVSLSPITPLDATGEPVAFPRISPASDVATAWSRGPYRGQQTLEQAKELLKATLSKLNRDPLVADATATLVTNAVVLVFRKWGYSPHFDTERLACEWYEKFNKL